MAQVTKITFSEAEMNVLTDTEFFRVKHAATQKILELFAESERELKKIIVVRQWQLENLEVKTGKIFRGESYRKLPYVVLDYPKLFSPSSIFAFRSMFWWGNEFSFTLHLQGEALDKFRESLDKNISQLLHHDFYFCIHDTPWQYYFREDNYVSLDSLFEKRNQLKELLAEKPFIKLSRRLPLSDYGKCTEYGTETFELLLKLLS